MFKREETSLGFLRSRLSLISLALLFLSTQMYQILLFASASLLIETNGLYVDRASFYLGLLSLLLVVKRLRSFGSCRSSRWWQALVVLGVESHDLKIYLFDLLLVLVLLLFLVLSCSCPCSCSCSWSWSWPWSRSCLCPCSCSCSCACSSIPPLMFNVLCLVSSI